MSALDRIINTVKNTVRLPYYYVRPCPRCGSRVTGRYMKHLNDTNADWQVNEALRNGELIEVVSEIPGGNCFCCECDYEWKENISMSLKTLKEIEEEKNKRGTGIILNERMKQVKYDRQNDHGMFRSFRRFMGKI